VADTNHERADADARAVARAALAAFGGERSVLRVHDGSGGFTDVLRCADSPYEGWACYSTLTLHRSSNLVAGEDIRVELAGMCALDVQGFAEALADACVEVRQGRWRAAPEILFADVFGDRISDTRFRHMLLCPPYPWEALSRLRLPGGSRVHWLLAFPISEGERQFFLEEGFERLERLFVEREAEYFDLSRDPVV
jgi:hypothetical protein